MDISGEGSVPDMDDDVGVEESTKVHEQQPGSSELLSSAQEATPGDQQFNDVQDDTNEQNNEIAVSLPGRQEAQTSELSRSFWCWCWPTLIVLGLSIGLFLQWLISVLVNNIIRIFGFRSRNGHSKTDNSQPLHIFLNIFMLFVIVIILTHTPLDVENTEPYNLVMPDNIFNIPVDVIDLLINNDNNNVNENATLYNNFDDDVTNRFTNDEPNVQAIVTESIASEAVDDRTYPVDSVEAQDDTLTNHDSDKESEQIFDSESDFDADDEVKTDFDSESDSINDNAESHIFEINFDMNDEDDNDEMSIISDITYNIRSEDDSINDNDYVLVSADDSYRTKSENVPSLDDDEEDGFVKIHNNFIPPTLSIDSSQVLNNPTRNINRPDPIETQDERHLNDDGGEESKKITSSEVVHHDDDQNDHLVFNNNQQDQMVSSIEIPSNDAQNNAQLVEMNSTDEQFPTQIFALDSALDQTSQIAQKTVDQIEDDRQEMVHSIRPTNIYFQKQPIPIINPNEESFNQNAE